MVSGGVSAGTSIAWASSFEARAGARRYRESLQSEQFADERFRQTGRKRREGRGPAAELPQAARGHHLGVSDFVDISLRLARYYPASFRARLPVHDERRSTESARLRLCYE